MRKLFAILAISALVFTACDDGNDSGTSGNNTGNNTNGQTTLTIVNAGDFNNMEFSYGDTGFGVMNRGQEVTKPVTAGTKYVYVILEYSFQDGTGIHQMFEINEALTTEEGINTRFHFTNSTVVTLVGGDTGYRESGGLTTGTLRNILAGIENYYRNGV
jgi:hypothetical protein